MSRYKGQLAEQSACDFLSQQGLSLVQRNYLCRVGEIDLVMLDGQTLVFVEVRARSHDRYGDGAMSVIASKQRKLLKACSHYLVSHGKYDKIPCRIDVVSLDNQGNIEWIKNAIIREY